jgi:hypothetical protein
MSARLPQSSCPSCGKLCDAATEVGGDAHPEPGDVSICFYCCGVSRYSATLVLEKLDLGTLRPALRAEVEHLQSLIRSRRPS